MSNKGKLVHGIGINDAGYAVMESVAVAVPKGEKYKRIITWRCPYYQRWVARIESCYSKKRHEKFPSYKDCVVSEDWLTFSNFREWMVSEEERLGGVGSLVGLQLDKDFLSPKGNKIYSKDTCVFIPSILNQFIKEHNNASGLWPVGVSEPKRAKYTVFLASCCNPFTKRQEYVRHLRCPILAHNAWKAKKHEHAIALVEQIEDMDSRVKYKLLTMYLPETDHLNGWVPPYQ